MWWIRCSGGVGADCKSEYFSIQPSPELAPKKHRTPTVLCSLVSWFRSSWDAVETLWCNTWCVSVNNLARLLKETLIFKQTDRQNPPKLINGFVFLKVSFFFAHKQKKPKKTTEQNESWLLACLLDQNGPTSSKVLCVFHNAAAKPAASPTNCKQDEFQLVLHLSTRWSHL